MPLEPWMRIGQPLEPGQAGSTDPAKEKKLHLILDEARKRGWTGHRPRPGQGVFNR